MSAALFVPRNEAWFGPNAPDPVAARHAQPTEGIAASRCRVSLFPSFGQIVRATDFGAVPTCVPWVPPNPYRKLPEDFESSVVLSVSGEILPLLDLRNGSALPSYRRFEASSRNNRLPARESKPHTCPVTVGRKSLSGHLFIVWGVLPSIWSRYSAPHDSAHRRGYRSLAVALDT